MTYIRMGIWGSVIWLNQAQIGLTGERVNSFQRLSIPLSIVYDRLVWLYWVTQFPHQTPVCLLQSVQWALPYESVHIKSVFPENGKSFEFSVSISWSAKWELKKNCYIPKLTGYCRIIQNNVYSECKSSGINVFRYGNVILM